VTDDHPRPSLGKVHMKYADLLAFDSRPTIRGEHERFCCPLCGPDHSIDAMHQSLSLRGGHFICHRCGARGILEEYRHAASTVKPKTVRQTVQDRFKVST